MIPIMKRVLSALVLGVILVLSLIWFIRDRAISRGRDNNKGIQQVSGAYGLPGSPNTPVASGRELALQGPVPATSGDSPGWRDYVSLQYGFEISYPADWESTADYENNYGKLPSGKRTPAYAGETRRLLTLEMDGPTQSHEGGGDFEDGAIITLRITGTDGKVEDWGFMPDKGAYVVSTDLATWVTRESSPFGGDKVEKIAIDSNEFIGAIEVACNGSDPCKPFGEAGGAYRILPSGRALLVGWERMNGANDFSYQKYFLPLLASLRLRK